MDTELATRVENLITNLQRLKSVTLPNYELKIGYLTIFSRNNDDYELLKLQLRTLGEEKEANNEK